MRFGRTLEISIYSPWRSSYIDYAKLKKLLRDDDSAPSSPATESKQVWTDDDESAFVHELVNVQLEKVHNFHKDMYEKLRDRTSKCEADLDTVAVADRGSENADSATDASSGNGKKPVPSKAERQRILTDVLSQLDQITKETNELEKYSRINYTGFLKAVKKHDRKRGTSYKIRPLLQVRLAALPFNKEDYSQLLYRLSAMYSFIRQHLDGAEKRLSTLSMSLVENQEGKDEYISRKFWVHPDNILEVKTVILRRLPVLVYNPQTSKVAEGSRPDSTVTSLYFDSPDFSLYTKKVDQGEAASMRLRWYGQLNAKPEVWVEKKVVKEDETSAESRITMKEKYVQRFIKDEYHMEKQAQKLENRAGAQSPEVRNFKSSVEEIQQFIKENNLQPALRANYNRTAFQIPGDDRVRISLDTDLAFIREDAIDADRPCRDPETWHRTDIDDNELSFPFSTIRKGEISRFPFALLEIKTRREDKRNEWIQDLIHSHLVKEAPRFSKFVHGVAQLFEDYVNTFPFWLSQIETDIRRDPQQAYEEEQAKRQKEIDDEFAVGSVFRNSMISLTPSRRAELGMISPVGSPEFAGSSMRSPRGKQNGQRSSVLGSSLAVEPSQLAETAEEPDDDDTGEHTHGTERLPRGGLKTLFPSFSTSKYAQAKRRGVVQLPPGVSKPDHWIKDQGPLKVEGKVWLANQRTFIKWQHVSVLLASLSLGLFNAAGPENNVARALAVVYTVIAVFTGAWGYGVYIWRTRLIERRSGKDFDAVAGPLVVCVALIVALLLNFAFKYRAAVEERQDGSTLLYTNQTRHLMYSEDL